MTFLKAAAPMIANSITVVDLKKWLGITLSATLCGASVNHPRLTWASPSAEPLTAPGTSELTLDFSDNGSSDNSIGGASRLVPDFRGTGQSGNHSGGASRGACPETDHKLTPLVPKEAGNGGYTTQATPTLWTYVPYTLDSDNPITFSLLDHQGNILYEVFQAVDQSPGVLKLELPAHLTLEVGQVYQWYLMVHCGDPSGQDAAGFVSGWITRVDPTAHLIPTDDVLVTLSTVELSNVYANQLIWYDALTVLGDALLLNPNNSQLIDAWTDLLALPSVRLDEISGAPIRDCCTLPHNSSTDSF